MAGIIDSDNNPELNAQLAALDIPDMTTMAPVSFAGEGKPEHDEIESEEGEVREREKEEEAKEEEEEDPIVDVSEVELPRQPVVTKAAPPPAPKVTKTMLSGVALAPSTRLVEDKLRQAKLVTTTVTMDAAKTAKTNGVKPAAQPKIKMQTPEELQLLQQKEPMEPDTPPVKPINGKARDASPSSSVSSGHSVISLQLRQAALQQKRARENKDGALVVQANGTYKDGDEVIRIDDDEEVDPKTKLLKLKGDIELEDDHGHDEDDEDSSSDFVDEDGEARDQPSSPVAKKKKDKKGSSHVSKSSKEEKAASSSSSSSKKPAPDSPAKPTGSLLAMKLKQMRSADNKSSSSSTSTTTTTTTTTTKAPSAADTTTAVLKKAAEAIALKDAKAKADKMKQEKEEKEKAKKEAEEAKAKAIAATEKRLAEEKTKREKIKAEKEAEAKKKAEEAKKTADEIKKKVDEAFLRSGEVKKKAEEAKKKVEESKKAVVAKGAAVVTDALKKATAAVAQSSKPAKPKAAEKKSGKEEAAIEPDEPKTATTKSESRVVVRDASNNTRVRDELFERCSEGCKQFNNACPKCVEHRKSVLQKLNLDAARIVKVAATAKKPEHDEWEVTNVKGDKVLVLNIPNQRILTSQSVNTPEKWRLIEERNNQYEAENGLIVPYVPEGVYRARMNKRKSTQNAAAASASEEVEEFFTEVKMAHTFASEWLDELKAMPLKSDDPNVQSQFDEIDECIRNIKYFVSNKGVVDDHTLDYLARDETPASVRDACLSMFGMPKIIAAATGPLKKRLVGILQRVYAESESENIRQAVNEIVSDTDVAEEVAQSEALLQKEDEEESTASEDDSDASSSEEEEDDDDGRRSRGRKSKAKSKRKSKKRHSSDDESESEEEKKKSGKRKSKKQKQKKKAESESEEEEEEKPKPKKKANGKRKSDDDEEEKESEDKTAAAANPLMALMASLSPEQVMAFLASQQQQTPVKPPAKKKKKVAASDDDE